MQRSHNSPTHVFGSVAITLPRLERSHKFENMRSNNTLAITIFNIRISKCLLLSVAITPFSVGTWKTLSFVRSHNSL